MGVAGCGWLSSFNINLMNRPSYTHINNAPSSASATSAATIFRMVHSVKILHSVSLLHRPLASIQGRSGHIRQVRLKWAEREQNLIIFFLKIGFPHMDGKPCPT